MQLEEELVRMASDGQMAKPTGWRMGRAVFNGPVHLDSLAAQKKKEKEKERKE